VHPSYIPSGSWELIKTNPNEPYTSIVDRNSSSNLDPQITIISPSEHYLAEGYFVIDAAYLGTDTDFAGVQVF